MELLERRLLFQISTNLFFELSVSSGFVLDSTVYVDEASAGSISLDIFVMNNGTLPVADVAVEVILSKDKEISVATDSITRVEAWSDMAGGEWSNSRHSPAVEAGIAHGYYFVGLRVDPDNVVSEVSEKNNVFWTAKPRIRIVTEAWPSGSIAGTDGNDGILVEEHVSDTFVSVNGVMKAMDPYGQFGTRDNCIFIDAGPGHDQIVAVNNVTTRLQVTGNTGNDTLVGGAGDDELSGSYGYDRVLGGAGNDFLLGGPFNDYLNGEAGNDLIIGGGGNDRLVDFVGRDHFVGGAGNDVLLTRDTRSTIHNNPDTLSGGRGYDRAQVDVIPSADNLVSIEELLT